MKSRIPPIALLNKAQARIAKAAAMETVDRQRVVWMRRFFKLMALALREPLSEKGHGMGPVQIVKIVEKITEYAATHDNNPEFWEETDYLVVDRMGLPFEKEEMMK